MKTLHGNGPVSRDWFGLDLFEPGPRFTRQGSRLFLLDEVGSTNDFLLGRGEPARGRECTLDPWGWSAREHELIQPLDHVESGLVCVARTQTSGKGRQGRRWVDCGGLHFSVVVPSHRAAFDKGFSVWLGLMTVLCLREDFGVDARLKWPNDIVSGGRKLGGILLENRVTADHTDIIAGLGLNLDTRADAFPAPLQGRATSMRMETGRRYRPGDVAGKILRRVEQEVDRFDTAGWQPWQHALVCLDCLLGRTIKLVVGDRQLTGRARGIDAAGGLLLETPDGQVSCLSAGEVHLLHQTSSDQEESTS
nr:biotin--[acetyl-CoA-carboxylase] ligase [Candidatus Krumholzibacteria bacterium]